MSVDLQKELGSALGDSYIIERELGGGGMSRVFVAEERRFGRKVVIKVLTHDLAAGFSAERFEREIKLAAQLQQANIVPVLGAGEIQSKDESSQLGIALPYYTMPFVEGESLRARLTTGQLPLGECIAILRDVAHALAYAHSRGVVHRDIKPENVLLSGGVAIVTDFGIAKALSASKRQAPGSTLTVVGTSLGTPAYMAPEQAVGDRVDERADIYAWGVVAYELLAGAHPFAGRNTAQQLIAAHIAERPRELKEVRPSVPPALGSLVMRSLEKDPGKRPQSASEILRVLDDPALVTSASSAQAGSRPHSITRWSRRSVVVAAVIGLLVLGAAIAGRGQIASLLHSTAGANTATSVAMTRLAVLPFENMGRPEDAYVVDGITDEIREKLASVPGLQVIARASSNQYRGSGKSPQAIAGELGVGYLLTGTVRSEPGPAGRPARVRVTPELVQVNPGSADAAPVSRWTQSMDAQLADVFAMQADIATRVASAMNVALGSTTQARLAEVPTRNPAAYDAYLRGEATGALSSGDAALLRRELAYSRQAVTLDSGFALAWAARARAAALLYLNSVPTPALAEEARSAAQRAQALAPDAPATALALGDYAWAVTTDNRQALATYTRARQLAPGNADLLSAAGNAERALGQSEAAVRDLRAAAALDPRSASAAGRLAATLLWARQYPEATRAADRALALVPAPASAIRLETRAMVELGNGDLAGARRVISPAPRGLAPAGLDRDALLAVLGNYWDLYWMLDDADQRRLLTLTPAAYDNDRSAWGIVRAETYWLRGDTARARIYADSARIAFEAQLREAPSDAQRHAILGVALAYLGRSAEAMREGERAVALEPVKRDAVIGSYMQHELARIYLLAGKPEKALDILEPLLRMPYYLSPGWLRIDPTFTPLRGNPRFERMVAGR
jgi:eukaryotic-like serine/threonine-protein kinase